MRDAQHESEEKALIEMAASMTEYFTWKNCTADVKATMNSTIVRAYVNEVVGPSLLSLDRQKQVWSESGDAGAVFAISDLDDLLESTIEAYCLAIQSLWERQLRNYVRYTARELDPPSEAKAKAAQWDDVLKLFARLRCINMNDFSQHGALTALHLLGNVCRHGDGPSLTRLIELKPGLWPDEPSWVDLDGETHFIERTADNMRVPRELLEELSEAVACFWDVAEYIYIESLVRKHESVVRRLPGLRRQYAGLISQNAGIVITE